MNVFVQFAPQVLYKVSHFLFDLCFFQRRKERLNSKLTKFLETDATTMNIYQRLHLIMNNLSLQ